MKYKLMIIFICMLLVGTVLPVSGIIKNYKEISYDRITSINGFKYDDRGFYINNILNKMPKNLENTFFDDPGEIIPDWITMQTRDYWRSVKVYKDYLYAAGMHPYIDSNVTDGILGKYDINNGNLLWKINISMDNHNTYAWSLDLYNDAIYVVGIMYPTSFLVSEIGAFLSKYDLNGNLLWMKIINDNTFNFINNIKIYNNYLYLCGSKDADAWLSKYDTDGNRIWKKSYNIPGILRISQIYNIDIYDDYIYGVGETDRVYSSSRQDIFVIRTNLRGNLIWYKKYGGFGPQLGSGIDVADGYVYVCGAGSSSYSIYSPMKTIILKYNRAGILQQKGGSSIRCFSTDLEVYDGALYTSGELLTHYSSGYGNYNGVISKFNSDLNLEWYLTGYSDVNNIEIVNDYLYLCGYYTINYGQGLILKYDINKYIDNIKPNKPSIPFGRTSGSKKNVYTYSTNSTDPDGDMIRYGFSWGDGNITHTQWFNSGEEVTDNHAWDKIGIYKIKVRARDSCGFVSDWSDPLDVTIRLTRSNHNQHIYNLFSRLSNIFPILKLLLQRLRY